MNVGGSNNMRFERYLPDFVRLIIVVLIAFVISLRSGRRWMGNCLEIYVLTKVFPKYPKKFSTHVYIIFCGKRPSAAKPRYMCWNVMLCLRMCVILCGPTIISG